MASFFRFVFKPLSLTTSDVVVCQLIKVDQKNRNRFTVWILQVAHLFGTDGAKHRKQRRNRGTDHGPLFADSRYMSCTSNSR